MRIYWKALGVRDDEKRELFDILGRSMILTGIIVGAMIGAVSGGWIGLVFGAVTGGVARVVFVSRNGFHG
jgi:hypothetical protein